MAVKFLNDIDLGLNELTSFAIQNIDVIGNRPSGVEGQMIFLESSSALQFYDGSGWVTLGDAAAAGTVTSVNLSGDSGTGTAITGSGVFAIEGTGVISTSITGRTLTISSSVTNYDSWELRSDDGIGSAFDVINGAVVTISGDTAITTSNTLGAVEIDLNDTAVNPGSYTYASITVDQQGRLTAAGSGTAPVTPSDALITLNTGAGFTAASGDAFTLDQAANETINFVIGAGPGIQVNSTSVQVDYTGANNIIDSAAAGTTLVVTDKFIAEDLSDNIVKEYEIQDIIDLVPAGDTYTLPVSAGGANSSVITLDAGSGTDTTVTFNGTTNEIALTESTGLNGSITIGLPDDVTIGDNLTVTGIITQNQTGETNTFASEVAVPTATASGNAPNLGQVQSLIAGVGIFQGGYNATTGLTTDLSSNGSLDGASNIALDKGDYFVVTVAGGAFYSETLEVGDMIYANQDITANSTPAQTVYTVVIQDANIAGAGSTDGATEKGVAGFNSNVFTVTANGFVEAKVFNGSQLGVVPNTSSNDATKFLNGQGTFATPAYVSYSAMNTATLGLGRLRYALGATPAANVQSTTAGKTYGVTKNASDQLIVNVPWDGGVETLTLNDGTYIDVNSSGTAADPVFTPDLNAVDGTSVAGTRFLSKDNTWDVPAFPTSSDFGVLTVGASTAANRLGIAISGTAQNPLVGLNITGLASATPVASDTIPFYDAGTNKKTTVANLTAAVQTATSQAYTIASGETTDDLTYPFTLTAATINDVMIQAVISSGTNAGETVFCDVDRISTTQCRITFASALTTSVRVLVQKIG